MYLVHYVVYTWIASNLDSIFTSNTTSYIKLGLKVEYMSAITWIAYLPCIQHIHATVKDYYFNNNLIFKPRIECLEHHFTYLKNGSEPDYLEKTQCELIHSFLSLQVSINKIVILENEKEKTDFYRFLQGRNLVKNESITIDNTFPDELKIKTENTFVLETYKEVIFE